MSRLELLSTRSVLTSDLYLRPRMVGMTPTPPARERELLQTTEYLTDAMLVEVGHAERETVHRGLEAS
jgi:hypothetical protein